MKRPIGKLSFLAVLLYLTACTKSDVSSNSNKPAGLAGEWNLVNDSAFEGAGSSNYLVVYSGGPATTSISAPTVTYTLKKVLC